MKMNTYSEQKVSRIKPGFCRLASRPSRFSKQFTRYPCAEMLPGDNPASPLLPGHSAALRPAPQAAPDLILIGLVENPRAQKGLCSNDNR